MTSAQADVESAGKEVSPYQGSPLVPGASVNQSQGVSVEIGEKQAAVDIDIVAEYGVAIADLAAGIRRNVIAAVERMTGLEVTEVNITVHDVHLDGDSGDDADAAPARVQ
jgi:uncharacterized alkaline shock family protein YloU